MPTGRRDGNRSVSQDALNNLPPPFVSAQQALNQFFIPKGLDAKDQLVLSGTYILLVSIELQQILPPLLELCTYLHEVICLFNQKLNLSTFHYEHFAHM